VNLFIVIPGCAEGAGPESMTTTALAACRIREKEKGALASLFVCANGPRAKRAGSMDSGLALRAPRNDDK
jgi:hypothetical protein